MRHPLFVAFALTGALAASASTMSSAQTRPTTHVMLNRGIIKIYRPVTFGIAGKWLYRSWVNDPSVTINDDPQSGQKALSILFGEGVMTLATPTATKVTGTFDMGGGYVLDLSGTVSVSAGVTRIHMAGLGRANTPTAGWEYDYDAEMAEKWPAGVNQIAAFTGSVFRAKPHDGNPAGVVAAFISVKKP